MYKPNYCSDLDTVVRWFTDLKNDGIPKSDILDAIEFDSEDRPDMEILKKAREIVYAKETL